MKKILNIYAYIRSYCRSFPFWRNVACLSLSPSSLIPHSHSHLPYRHHQAPSLASHPAVASLALALDLPLDPRRHRSIFSPRLAPRRPSLAHHATTTHTHARARRRPKEGKMTPLASLVFLLLLPCICQSNALPAAWLSGDGASIKHNAVAFFPRGGGIGRGRRRRKGRSKTPAPVDIADDDSNEEAPAEEDAAAAVAAGEEGSSSSFDLEEASKKVYQEEVAEIKESQQFLQKQQRRRELDKTWLDKGITAFIEFFENLFRWKVIDV